jgi:hypothetical protein
MAVAEEAAAADGKRLCISFFLFILLDYVINNK